MRYLKYLKHYPWAKLKLGQKNYDFINDSLEAKSCLATLYDTVILRGGFREVIAEQKWKDVAADVKICKELMRA